MKCITGYVFLSLTMLVSGVHAQDDAPKATPEVAEQEVFDRLSFFNGDSIIGSLVTLDPATGLSWSHPHAAEDIPFLLDDVTDVTFKGPFPKDALKGLSRVELTNGDSYSGRILAMDDTLLQLETPFAGTVSLQSAMVTSLFPMNISTALYSGPSGLDEWNEDEQSSGWSYRDGALIAEKGTNSSISKKFHNLPDLAELRFSLIWKDQLSTTISLWKDITASGETEQYQLRFQRGYIRLTRYSGEHGTKQFSYVRADVFQKASKADFRLLLNRKSKEILLMVNDTLLKKWQDPRGGVLKGEGFTVNNSGGSVRLSDIEVLEWDGRVNNSSVEETGDKDFLLLTSGDRFRGKLVKVDAKQILFQTEYAELPIPIERVHRITLAPDNRITPDQNPGDFQIFLPNDDRITLGAASLETDALKGVSAAAGDLHLNPRFVSKLVFNPYDERHEDFSTAW